MILKICLNICILIQGTSPLYKLKLLIILVSLPLIFCSCSDSDNGPRILVFSKTKGWKHSSIPAGNEALIKLGTQNGFAVDTTKDASVFSDDELKKYRVVVFFNTTGNVLNAEQQAAFERYIQAGGGFVGIHSAAATEYEWPWYNKLIGAHFSNHPLNPGVRKGVIEVTNKNHPATKGLPARWERNEEWYSYRSFYGGINVLAQLDENSYEGGTNGSYHPISWYHEYDGGRSFYTGSGHDEASYQEPLFLQHLLGGIQYAMGDGKLDYSKAYAVTMPEENRFIKTVLVNDLDTPMELDIADDGRIFFTELRSANLTMHNTATGETSLLHRFDVCTKGGAGLIGITLDPNFTSNGFIYLYYSPPTEKEPIIFNLSRFTISRENKLDLASEKILLQVPVQANSGAHHGGSLAWDKHGNLYISTGDSSSPFPANGYAPLDERAGEEFYSLDAQRGSSNTNDLKGKILRIHPEPDGTYSIPNGNLFPKGKDKTLPEIYVMGCRNPYRIAVNPKTSVLYWGEIGPDAGKDSIQGPRGYDEFNQAKKPGNYGWPYFVGNNYAYAKWNFATNTAGPRYDALAPVNNSPNNTGLTNLPPATPAMIWYPYAPSKDFPELGQGGRSAMAGDFYTFNKGANSPNKFPEYYDGALFVFDWMRNWVLALRFDENEHYLRSEPFMASNGDFRRPIDMTFGTDGVMYMLEYGSVYGADNEDARLVKIEYYTGNRAPVAKAGIPEPEGKDWNSKVYLTSEQATPLVKEFSGPAPLEVSFTSIGSKELDDADEITYKWHFEKNSTSNEAKPVHVFKKPGVYNVVLTVTDQKGLTGSDSVLVRVGNTKPELNILTQNNKSFYWDKKPFAYAVKITDQEDGVIDPKNVSIDMQYNPEPGMEKSDVIVRQKLTQTDEPPARGYLKIADSDCKACHTVDKISVGPSYIAISERYKNDANAPGLLTKKIIAGGGGNWGTTHVMSAHPQLTDSDAAEMVKYILGITNPKNKKTSLPSQGIVPLKLHRTTEVRGTYTITASYTDKGSNGIPPLTDTEVIKLRSPKLTPLDADAYVGAERWGKSFGSAKNKAYVLFKNIDLTTIKKIIIEYGAQKDGEIEVRLESLAGPVIAKMPFTSTSGEDNNAKTSAEIRTPVTGRHHVYFIIVDRKKSLDGVIDLWTFEFQP